MGQLFEEKGHELFQSFYEMSSNLKESNTIADDVEEEKVNKKKPKSSSNKKIDAFAKKS